MFLMWTDRCDLDPEVELFVSGADDDATAGLWVIRQAGFELDESVELQRGRQA